MATQLILSKNDLRLLNTLSIRVRVLTLAQISNAFFGEDDCYARRRIDRLAKHGLIVPRFLVSRVSPQLEAPLVRWLPSQVAPDFESLSSRLVSRWGRLNSKSVLCYVLGVQAAKLIGGSRRNGIKHSHQASHDIALSEVFVHYVRELPDLAERWIGEDSLELLKINRAASGNAIPDAMILDQNNLPQYAVELGGIYTPSRLANLHESFSKRSIGYELW